MISRASFSRNSMAEFTRAWVSGDRTPSSSMVSMMVTRSSSVTVAASSLVKIRERIREIPEKKKLTGVSSRTNSCMEEAKIRAISSLRALARLLGSISAKRYTITVVITVPYTTYSSENCRSTSSAEREAQAAWKILLPMRMVVRVLSNRSQIHRAFWARRLPLSARVRNRTRLTPV